MEKNIALIFSGVILLIGLTVMYCSNLHNVDLVFNAKHIDKLSDDNGIIEQSVKKIYQRSILSLWILPMIMIFPIWMICWGIAKRGDNHGKRRF